MGFAGTTGPGGPGTVYLRALRLPGTRPADLADAWQNPREVSEGGFLSHR